MAPPLFPGLSPRLHPPGTVIFVSQRYPHNILFRTCPGSGTRTQCTTLFSMLFAPKLYKSGYAGSTISFSHISHGSCRESSFPRLCSVTTELVFTNFTAFQIVQTCANKSQRREHSASELPAFSPRMQRKHEKFSFCKKSRATCIFSPLCQNKS